jgi:hypothetical protein
MYGLQITFSSMYRKQVTCSSMPQKLNAYQYHAVSRPQGIIRQILKLFQNNLNTSRNNVETLDLVRLIMFLSWQMILDTTFVMFLWRKIRQKWDKRKSRKHNLYLSCNEPTEYYTRKEPNIVTAHQKASLSATETKLLF